MKTQMTKYICALMLVAPSYAFATGGTESTGTETVGSSVKDSSDKAGSQNSAGQLMSYLTGAKLFGESAQHFGKCPQPSPGDCALGALKAAMGILSMMQGGQHGSTAGGASFSSGLTNGSDAYTPGNNNPYDSETSAAYQAVKDGLAKLEKGVGGSKIDVKKGTITTHDGKTYDLKKLGTPEGMASAGFSPGAIAGAMEYGQKISKEMQDKVDKMKIGAHTATAGFEEGGGGGNGSGGVASADSGGYGGGATGNLQRDPAASVAGMQKNYNGEPIGVAADSIFLMMNRRYKVKESQDSFFTDAELALQK